MTAGNSKVIRNTQEGITWIQPVANRVCGRGALPRPGWGEAPSPHERPLGDDGNKLEGVWGTTPTNFAPFGAATGIPDPPALSRRSRHQPSLMTEDLQAIHQRVSLLTAYRVTVLFRFSSDRRWRG